MPLDALTRIKSKHRYIQKQRTHQQQANTQANNFVGYSWTSSQKRKGTVRSADQLQAKAAAKGKPLFADHLQDPSRTESTEDTLVYNLETCKNLKIVLLPDSREKDKHLSFLAAPAR